MNYTMLSFGNAKRLCLFCLMRQNEIHGFTWADQGLDRTDGFQKFCVSGLDRIQFLRIRIGLGVKISQSAHLWLRHHCC